MMQCNTTAPSKPSTTTNATTSTSSTTTTPSARFASFSAPSSIDLETSQSVAPPTVRVSPGPPGGSNTPGMYTLDQSYQYLTSLLLFP